MNRVFSLCGVAFVVVTLVTVIGLESGSPSDATKAADIVSYYDHDLWRHILASVLLTVSVPLVVLFAVELAETTGRGTRTPWSYVLVAGGVLVGAALQVVALVHFALGDAGDQGLPVGVQQTLTILDIDNWILFNPAFGVLMLGAAGCMWRRAGAERWLAKVALLFGLMLFIPFANFPALLGTLVWIAVVGVLRALGQPEVAGTSRAATA